MSSYEDYEEEDCEEEPEEGTEIKVDDTKITVIVETENLQQSIVNALRAELYNSMKAAIVADIKAEILPALKTEVVNHTKEIVQSLIDDIYENDKITIGGGWHEKQEEITFKEFIRREIKKTVESGKFEDKRGYSTTFSDYLTKQCVGSEVENFMQKSVDGMRKDINAKLKTIFDTQTKNLLSETVINVLMASETYQGIENSIKRLADKN